MTGFEVVADELTVHAGHLDGLGDRLDGVLAGASAAAMPGNAYGLLCSFVPPIVNPVQDKGKDAVRASGAAIRATADNVRTAAGSYADRDEATAQPFRDYLA